LYVEMTSGSTNQMNSTGSLVLSAIDLIEDPVEAAAVLAFRVARAQAFAEGNKRTALLVARWVLDRNGLEGAAFLPSDDREIGALLIKAASGLDIGPDFVALLLARRWQQGS
jgi:prophage maintenance system killer protein